MTVTSRSCWAMYEIKSMRYVLAVLILHPPLLVVIRPAIVSVMPVGNNESQVWQHILVLLLWWLKVGQDIRKTSVWMRLKRHFL